MSDIEDPVSDTEDPVTDNEDSSTDTELIIDEDIEELEDGEEAEEAELEQETNVSLNNSEPFMEMTSDNESDDEVIKNEELRKITHKDDILIHHSETKFHNYDEIYAAAIVTRNSENIIVDKLHSTFPILSKYEKTKVLGQRTKQLNLGNNPFITLARPTIDNSIIAEEELKQKKIPFIIQRPLPNGGFEYWHLRDLEVL
jgi:DNA-directed RNA polymerase subunit K/omega